jgi:hypothetical protein
MQLKLFNLGYTKYQINYFCLLYFVVIAIRIQYTSVLLRSESQADTYVTSQF